MSCHFDQELLTGYYDGALDAAERKSVEVHISTCSDCLRLLEDIKGVATQLHALPRATAPAAIREAVRQETSARPMSHRRAGAWRQGLVAAAAAVMVACSLFIVSGEPPADPGLARQESQEYARTLRAPAASPTAHGFVAGQMKKEEAEKADARGQELEGKGGRFTDDAKDAEKADIKERRDFSEDKAKLKRDEDSSKDGQALPMEPARPVVPDPAAPPAPALEMEPLEESIQGVDRGAGNKPDDNEEKSYGGGSGSGARLAATPPPAVIRFRSADPAKARLNAEAILKSIRATTVAGAPELGDIPEVKVHYLSVELSDEQAEALRKQMGTARVEATAGTWSEELARARGWAEERKKEGRFRSELGGASKETDTAKPEKSGAGPGAKAKSPEPPKPQPATGAPDPKPAAGDDPSHREGADAMSKAAAEQPKRRKYVLYFEGAPPTPSPSPSKK